MRAYFKTYFVCCAMRVLPEGALPPESVIHSRKDLCSRGFAYTSV